MSVSRFWDLLQRIQVNVADMKKDMRSQTFQEAFVEL